MENSYVNIKKIAQAKGLKADTEFLDLYNSGLYLPKAYEFLGSISIGILELLLQQGFNPHEI